MKTYKIVTEITTFIFAIIFFALGSISSLVPKEIFGTLVDKRLVILIFIVASIFFLLYSAVFGKIKEVKEKEYLDGE